MREIPLGTTGTAKIVVTQETLASSTGSGAVDVFSTPRLVLLMEEAAMDALRSYMETDETSVGTVVNIRHIAATPMGFNVTATARLLEIDGRRLVFQVEASDDLEKIGEGTHERFLVFNSKFKLRSHEKSTRRNISSAE